ncbi:hypothetical protein [Xenorhabdus hominickii]|nr:hypothetical protein [Xenorhabdus hominickii]
MTDVDVYIFDEPTNGLDVASVKFFKTIINSLAKNKIIIFSSHDENFLHGLNINSYQINEKNIIKIEN